MRFVGPVVRSLLLQAVAETCGRSVDAIKGQLEEEGDLGVVALSSRAKQVPQCTPERPPCDDYEVRTTQQ